jgi:8-oxo-dGTP pyrophosphatase MutT (NUDIX family)
MSTPSPLQKPDLSLHLTSEEREKTTSTVLRPKDAASMIILDFKGKTPKVLMGRRNSKHVFMPNQFVFPCGRSDASDRKMLVAGSLPEASELYLSARTVRSSGLKNRALALAAIRETFEETGLMLGSADYGAPEVGTRFKKIPEGAHPSLKTSYETWQKFADQGIFPELDQLQFVARAITPTFRPKRFDTRFFAVDRRAVAYVEAGIVDENAELTELCWVGFKEAMHLNIPTITGFILQEIAVRLEQGFLPLLPVPLFRPQGQKFVRDVLRG